MADLVTLHSFMHLFHQSKNIYVVAPHGRTSPQCLGNQNKIYLNPSPPTKGIYNIRNKQLFKVQKLKYKVIPYRNPKCKGALEG